jgi:hypothetical protein
MSIHRTSVRRPAALLAVLAAAGLVVALPPAATAAAPAPGSCAEVLDPADQLPTGLEEGDRLFAVDQRNYEVHIVCGRLALTEVTGFDSCYLLAAYALRRYPC